MNVSYGILVGLAAFDLVVLAFAYLSLRANAPLDRRVLVPSVAGIAGFVVHAFLFFDGAILILQLATYTGIATLSVLASRKPVKAVKSVTHL